MPRKQLAINKELVENLAAIGCTDAEIAAVCRVSERTIQRRCRLSIDAGRARLKESLKRKQVELALSGNTAMLIWLGKQYLDQRDRQDVAHSGEELKIVERIITDRTD
ncbi:MAG: hypothetical protein Kow0040_14910 [Thermogutta sp.]